MTDPRFPNRPDHHDFIRLSACVIEADDQATDRSVDDIVSRDIDMKSAIYMAEQRSLRLMDIVRREAIESAFGGGRPLMEAMHTALQATWLDGLRAGIRFQQEGGTEQ